MKPFYQLLAVMITALFAAIASVSFEVASSLVGAFSAFLALILGINFVSALLGQTKSVNTAFALQTEIWVRDIMENLFRGMEFVKSSIDDSAFVNNKVVHIPNAGAAPGIAKNRATFPGTIAERTDVDITYNVDNYTTDPIRVRDFDEVQVSYSKRQNVMSEHIAALSERIGDEMAYNWAPSASADHVLRTSGDDSALNLAEGATGTRKKVTKEDIARLAKKLDKDKIAKQGRVLLMPADMYYELFEVDALIRADYMRGASSLPQGFVNKLFGFDIAIRETVTIFDNAGNPAKKAVGAASAVTDNHGAIAYSKFAVRRAVGSIKVYHNPEVAEHYGDIMSAEVNFGGRIGRNDLKGVASLVQTAGA